MVRWGHDRCTIRGHAVYCVWGSVVLLLQIAKRYKCQDGGYRRGSAVSTFNFSQVIRRPFFDAWTIASDVNAWSQGLEANSRAKSVVSWFALRDVFCSTAKKSLVLLCFGTTVLEITENSSHALPSHFCKGRVLFRRVREQRSTVQLTSLQNCDNEAWDDVVCQLYFGGRFCNFWPSFIM